MNKKIALKQLKLLEKDVKSMRLAAESWKTPFQTLISTIMSARTRDEVTIPIAELLFRKFPTPEKLAKANVLQVQAIIKPVNFYKNKSKNVIACAKAIVKDFNGKVPETIEELIKLPGVGRKTANVFISEYGKPGIAVDTHVHYISNYLGWSKNKNPHKVESDLKKLFPEKTWSRVNPTLVRFGKTHTSRTEKNKILDSIKVINE
jgi:endonuclease-3